MALFEGSRNRLSLTAALGKKRKKQQSTIDLLVLDEETIQTAALGSSKVYHTNLACHLFYPVCRLPRVVSVKNKITPPRQIRTFFTFFSLKVKVR